MQNRIQLISNIHPIEYLISKDSLMLKTSYFNKNRGIVIDAFILSLIRQHKLLVNNQKNKFIVEKIKTTTDNLIKIHIKFNISEEYQQKLTHFINSHQNSTIYENIYIQLKFLLLNSKTKNIIKI